MEKFSYVAGYLSGSHVYQSVSDYFFDDVTGVAPRLIGGKPSKEWFTQALTEACREAGYEVIAEAADNFHKQVVVYCHIVYNGLVVEFHKEYDQANFIDFEDMSETVEDELVDWAVRKFGTVIAQLPEEVPYEVND